MIKSNPITPIIINKINDTNTQVFVMLKCKLSLIISTIKLTKNNIYIGTNADIKRINLLMLNYASINYI